MFVPRIKGESKNSLTILVVMDYNSMSALNFLLFDGGREVRMSMKRFFREDQQRMKTIFGLYGLSVPSFVDGMRSALDLLGGGQIASLKWLDDDPGTLDTLSLRSDWEAIEQDFHKSILSIEQS